MVSLNLPRKLHEMDHSLEPEMTAGAPVEVDVDIDLKEVYFLIIHFLSSSPCRRTYAQFWNELLEHQLLPRRYHGWYSRSGEPSGDENDDGCSLPLNYSSLLKRYPHVEQGHLVKLLKQLLLNCSRSSHGMVGGNFPNAADVPTLLGSGTFSLLGSNLDIEDQRAYRLPVHSRWPHIHADQVRGLSLREMGGGFAKHHRAPSVRAACYAIAKPSTMLQNMEIKKRLRGHQNAVYCAIFDRSGRHVITGSDDRLVKIWSMETAFCLASCRGHEGDITDLAVSSNNALVASASNDFIIRVWRLPDGLPISVLRGHTGAVTAIAFSPRPSAVYQLLSSSDDGTCRIWDARYSQTSPRVYIPKPPDVIPGKPSLPSSSTPQQGHQILCCAYNASGTVFVTGSSDTYARVWNACKINLEDAEQPNHEMDLLSGHENDVNYVQFSGCATVSRSTMADTSKEDNLPKFKNSWFTHDNIVTCSRDGSAIIWIPRSRRSHGKVGRWTRAYHLRVPPPPVPPQPPRGGPRQRLQPTPRGVNMIVWSLDNRFVLAAIMDCRICVWNASDGSLVHSLMGHSESTFVLDVHPFNPRIAMSAGYDGKTIIWDIWEGTPVRIYETGRFKLVDGKFSPDGTSIVLSDEVGQILVIATGQGDSLEDAKYDQFFLGDYRPLIQDTHGNILDQETQLPPHHRNMQDLLCDSSLIPYPEPYQSMYQRRRLGALGIEWHPPSVKFAVGPGENINAAAFQIPLIDLERWIEPIPEFVDAVDWEQENEVQSEDTDSEYDAAEEFSSEADHESVSVGVSGDSQCSPEESEVNHSTAKDGLRRSKRKNQKSEVELTTSSGRRVKRRNLDERDGPAASMNQRTRKQKNGKSRRKSSKSKSLRPQRRAARNALTLFSQINEASSDGEEDDVSETDSSESGSMLQDSYTLSNESDHSVLGAQGKHAKQKDVLVVDENPSTTRRLVVKFSVRDRREAPPEDVTRGGHLQEGKAVEALSSDRLNVNGTCSTSYEAAESSARAADAGLSENGGGDKVSERWQAEKFVDQPDVVPSGYKGGTIKWGEVKTRSTKRLRLSEASPAQNPNVDDPNDDDKEHEQAAFASSKIEQPSPNAEDESRPFPPNHHHHHHHPHPHPSGRRHRATSNGQAAGSCSEDVIIRSSTGINDEDELQQERGDDASVDLEGSSAPDSVDAKPVYRRLKIKSSRLAGEPESPSSRLKSVAVDAWDSDCGLMLGDLLQVEEKNQHTVAIRADEGTSGHSPDHGDWNDVSGKLDSGTCLQILILKSTQLFTGGLVHLGAEEEEYWEVRTLGRWKFYPMEICPTAQLCGDVQGGGGRREIRHEWLRTVLVRETAVGLEDDRRAKISPEQRENYSACDLSPLGKRRTQNSTKKMSWLLLSEHEEGYRYIPQLGDEVIYLRQGHEEYLRASHAQEVGPWKLVKGQPEGGGAVQSGCVDYSALPGSGESCCKLTLEFADPSCCAYQKAFKLTLPELVAFPDFLVERRRYEVAMERNWTHRDKCQVWWRNEGGDGGSWWEGRVVAVKPKSPDFPDSPWERFVVQYKNDSSGQHLHSPWELHDAGTQWEHPRLDGRTSALLLSSLSRLEQLSSTNTDYHGIQKLNQVALKSDFLNRFPVPLSPEVIRRRVESGYYRKVEAVRHDVGVMLSNAASYFAKSAELSLKVRRLSEAMTRALSSL
ncbi:unnamed protein product [Spirodela intermedia]|uniref:Bromo domain-containing protein n=1 Tax=Spirodela intermedia TaxID=51605 RepID=A0A7I8JSQ3_SPIIN|nr:unnamed protein product [Spirodela intermedia]CAA6673220.1 unnamed protein product [Spirodela intermedia]